MSDNIEVVVRVRPPLPREKGETLHWKVTDANANSLVQVTAHDKSTAVFSFDKVFDRDSENDSIFTKVMQPIVDGALNGINGTVFAYGQTSSGKTHTMMGSADDPGIIPLTIQSIFRGIEDTPNRQYLIRASYMEIYNEQIADLLVGRSSIPGNKGLAVREDSTGNIYVADLKEECVTDESKLLSMMQRGNRNRQVGCTNMNDRSSRSHTIFRIIVESQTTIDEDTSLGAAASEDDVAVTVSHLNLVDLAGSENAAQTGASGDRLKEGGFINKSLFMLGRVISQLSDGEAFINYRDSKLTRILQCSLGGNARTAIICTITPASLDQTYSTLRFASRAKNIKNKPVVNEVLSEAALLKRYSKEIKQLQLALEAERQSNKADEVIQVKEKLDAVEQMNENLKSKVRTLNEKLVTSSSCRTPGKKKEDKASRRKTWAAPVIKGRATSFSPLDLASINAEFSFPFNAPLSATTDDRLTSRRCELPRISETESLSECSFLTATDEFSNINSSILKRLDQSFETRLDASALDQSAASDVFAFPSVRSRPKVSFASPSMTITEENSALPASVTRRRRKGSSKLSAPDPPAKDFRDAEAQTDTSLLPKINLLSSPRTPHRCSPIKATSSPVKLGLSTPQGETPRKTLRFRIEQLNECLKEKDGSMSQLSEQLAELQELHEFVEADHVFREESLLAKLEQGSDDDDVLVSSLRSKVASLTRSLQDSEVLLLDANKRVSEQTQQLAMSSLAVEELTQENARLAAQCAQLAPLQQLAAALAAENEKLKREISEQQSNVVSMTKDKKDFDILMELKLEKQLQTEARLRKSLQEAWDELARLEGGDATTAQLRMEKASELEAQVLQLQEQLDELEPLKLKCEEQHQNIVRLEALLEEQQHSTRSAEEALAEMKAAADLALRDTQLVQVKAQSEVDRASQSSSSIEAEAAALQSRCAELEKALQCHQASEAEVANALSKLSQLRGALAVKADKETDLLAQIEELQSLAEADKCSTECKNCEELMKKIQQLSSAQIQIEGSKEDQKENDSTSANVTELNKDVCEENGSSSNEATAEENIQSDNDTVTASGAENVLSHDLCRKDRGLMDMAEDEQGVLNFTSNDRAELGSENATSECTVTEHEEEQKTLLVQLEDTISSTRKEAEELKNRLSSSIKKVEELQADLDEANRNLVGVTAEKEALVEKMEETLSSLQKEVSDLTIERKSLKEKLEAAYETTQPESMVCSEKKTLAMEKKSTEVITTVVEEISTLEVASSPNKSGPCVKFNEPKEASLPIVSLNEEIANLKAENEKLCIELEEIESLNLNHLTMKSEVEELTEEIERLKSLKEDLSRDECAKSGETITTQTDLLQVDLRELEVQNEKLVKEASSLEAELCALRKEPPLREDSMSNTTELDCSPSVIESETVSGVEKETLDVNASPLCSAECEGPAASSETDMKVLEVSDSPLIDPETNIAESHNEATGPGGVASDIQNNEADGVDLLQKTVETLKNEITHKNAEIDALQSKIAEMFTIMHEKNNQSELNVQSNRTESRDGCEGDSKSNMAKEMAKGLEEMEKGLTEKEEGLEEKEEKIEDQSQYLVRSESTLQTPKDESSQEEVVLERRTIKLEKEKDSLLSVQESEVLDLTNQTESKEQPKFTEDEVKVQHSFVPENNAVKHLDEQTEEISQQVTTEHNKAVEYISPVDLNSEIGFAQQNMGSLEDRRQEDLSTTMSKIGSPVEQEMGELMLPDCEELKVKKEMIQGIQQEIDELKVKKEELQGIQQEIDELKVKKEELQAIQQEIEELQGIQLEIGELKLEKEELQGLQREIEDLKVKKEELQGLQEEIEELKERKEELQGLQQEIEELKLKKEELQGLHQEIENLKEKKEELQGLQQEVEELTLKKEELQGLQQEIENLKEKKEELQGLQQEIEELKLKKGELQGLQQEIEYLKVKKEELQGLQQEIEELKLKKEELQGLQQEIENLKEKKEELQGLQQEIEELKLKKEELHGLQQEIEEPKVKKEELQVLQEEIEELKERKEELQGLQQEVEDLKVKKEELQGLQQEIEELKLKKVELQGLQQEIEDRKLKKVELREIQQEIADLKLKKVELREIQQEIEDLKERKEELQGLQEEIEDLKVKEEELQGLQEEIEDLEVKKEELQGLQQEIEELKLKKKEFQGLQQEIEELKLKKEELKGLHQEIEDLKEKKEELQGLQQEIEGLKLKKEELREIQLEIDEMNIKTEVLRSIQQEFEELKEKKEALKSLKQEINVLQKQSDERLRKEQSTQKLEEEQKEKLLSLQQDIEELAEQREELLQEVSELSDKRKELQYSMSARRRRSTLTRRVSSAPSARDELYESMLSVCGDDSVLMRGSVSHNPSLASVSHRLLQSLSVLEDSLMASPAGADVTAASHDRTDVPEELTVDQLSDIRDQLLSLQRALLLTSNAEAAANLANLASCAVYAEREAEVQTWTLMEAFRREYHLSCHATQPRSLLNVTDDQDGDVGTKHKSCSVPEPPRVEDLCSRSKIEELKDEVTRLTSENERLTSELHGALGQSTEHSSTSVNYETPIEEVITVKVETEQTFSEAKNESVAVEDPLRTDISVARAAEVCSKNREKEFISDVSRSYMSASTCVVKPLLRLDTTQHPSEDTYMSDCDVTIPVSFPRDVDAAGGGMSLEEEMRMASVQQKLNETCDQTARGQLENVSPAKEMPSQRNHLYPGSPSGETDCSIKVFGVSQPSNDDSTEDQNDHNTSTVSENTCEPYNSDELSFQNSEYDNAASEESMRRLSVTPVHPAVYARLLREKERLCDRVEALLADLDEVTASFEEKMTRNGELEKRLQEQALCVEALEKRLKDRGLPVDEDNMAPVSKPEHGGLGTFPDSSLVECTDVSVSKLNDSGVVKSSNDSLQSNNSGNAGLQPVCESSVKDPTEENWHTVEDLKQQLAEANLAVEEMHCLRWRITDLEEQKLEMTNELAVMRAALSSDQKFNDKNVTREEIGNGVANAGENSSLGEESCAPAAASVESETENTGDSVYAVVAAGGNVKPCEDGNRTQQADSEANIPSLNCSRSSVATSPALGCTECESLRVAIEAIKEQLDRKNAEIDQLSKACKSSQTNCQRLENELLLMQNSNKILQSEVESLRNDAEEREALHLKKCSDFEQQEKTITKLKADIITESVEHQQMLDELKKTLRAKETKLAEAEKQVSLQEKDKDSYMESLLAELSAKNGNLQSLSDQLSVVKKDLAEARLSYERLAALCKTCAVKLTQLSSFDSDMPSLGSSERGDCESSEFGFIADAVENLVDKYIAARKETDKLKDDVQNLRLTVDRKSADMTALQETHEEEIKKVLAMVDDKEMEKEEAIKEERKQKEECQVQLRHELESKRKQLEQLEEASIELEQEMKVKENHIENIIIQLKGEEVKVLKQQNDLSAVRSEMALLVDDNEKRKLKMKELTEELSQLKESSARLAEVQKCLDEAWSTIEELKLETSRTTEQKEQCEENLKREKEKSSNLEYRLDFESKKKDDLESNKMQLKEDVDRLTEVVEKHEFELLEKESKLSCLEAEHSKCQAKITEKDTKLFVLQTSNASFEQKLIEKNEKCETLAMDLSFSNKSLLEVKQQLATIMKEHSACKEKMPAANDKLKQFDARGEELTQLKLKLFEKEQESVTLSTECEKRVQALQVSLKEATRTKEAALADLTKKLEEEEEKMASLQAECRELSLKHASILSSFQAPATLYEMVPEDQRKLYVEGLVRIHQGQNGSLDIPVSRTPDRSGETKELQRQVKELKEQVQEKEGRCKQLDEELDDVVQHFENRIASYRSDMAGMPAKILALEASNDKLTTENKNLTSKLNKLQQNAGRLQEEKQQLESSLAQLQNESKSTPGRKEEPGSHTAEQSTELTKCLQKLREKESECQELEDAVQYYEKQIALYKTDRKSMRGQLDKLQTENKSKLEEHTSLVNKLTSLEMKVQREDEEKERLRRTLQETMSSKKKLEEELIVLKAHKNSSHVTPDNAAGRGGGLRSSSSQRAAREQQVAQFESLSNAEKEIKELREKLHFAETKATRYREELRRLQNTGPLDSTVCQLRSSGAASSSAAAPNATAAKPPPIMPLSSPEVHSAEDAQKDSSAFSYETGSHMVLSSQVLELRREIYQLEKTKKSLESENKSISHHLNHYKTKAQEWKISSLAHQRASAKWKDEVERLEKMQVASEKIVSEDGDTCLTESQSTMHSKNSHYLPDAAAPAGVHRDVLKELNSVRSGGGATKEEPLRKGVQASENMPPSHANVNTLREPVRASHLGTNTSAYSSAPDTIVSSRKCNIGDSQGFYTSALQATDSKVSSMEPTFTSKPSTLSAEIIKGLSTEDRVTRDSVKRGVHGSSASALYSGSGGEASSKGYTPGDFESMSSGYSSSVGPQSGRRSKDESNVKYFRRESKSKNDEDCKTQ